MSYFSKLRFVLLCSLFLCFLTMPLAFGLTVLPHGCGQDLSVDGETYQFASPSTDLECVGVAAGNGFTITADNIQVDCQNMRLVGDDIGSGVLVTGDNVRIENCRFDSFAKGVNLYRSESSELIDVDAKNNVEEGIYLTGSHYALLEDVFVENNGGDGILVDSSDNVELIDFEVKDSTESGIYVEASDLTSVSDGLVSSNLAAGVELFEATNSLFSNVESVGNSEEGFFVSSSTGVVIEESDSVENEFGFRAADDSVVDLQRNYICENVGGDGVAGTRDQFLCEGDSEVTGTANFLLMPPSTDFLGICHEYPTVDGVENFNCNDIGSVITSCGQEITSPGTYILGTDLVCDSSHGNGLVISADDVDFSCGPYSIAGSEAWYGIHVTGDRVSVSDCSIEDFGVGVVLESVDEPTVSDMVITSSSGDGLRLDVVNGGTFENNQIFDSDSVNLEVSEGNNNVFVSSTFSGSGYHNVLFEDSSGNTFENNVVTGSDFQGALFLTGSENNLIQRNQLYGNVLSGLYIGSSENNEVFANVIYDNQEQGIRLAMAGPTVVEGNYMCDNVLEDFFCDSNSFASGSNNYAGRESGDIMECGDDWPASEQNFVCDDFGFVHHCAQELVLPAVYTLSTDLDCSASSGDGLTINGNDITLSCNGHSILGSGTGDGVFATGSNIGIQSCRIDSFNNGFYLEEVSAGYIADNTLLYSHENGIETEAMVASILVGNTVTDGLVRGMYIRGASDGNVIDGNTISGHSSERGIWLRNSEENTLNGNIITGNKKGIGILDVGMDPGFGPTVLSNNEICDSIGYDVFCADTSTVEGTGNIFGSSELDATYGDRIQLCTSGWPVLEADHSYCGVDFESITDQVTCESLDGIWYEGICYDPLVADIDADGDVDVDDAQEYIVNVGTYLGTLIDWENIKLFTYLYFNQPVS